MAKTPAYIHIGEHLNQTGILGPIPKALYQIDSSLPDNDWIFRIDTFGQKNGRGGTDEFITVDEFKEQFIVLSEKEDPGKFVQTRLE